MGRRGDAGPCGPQRGGAPDDKDHHTHIPGWRRRRSQPSLFNVKASAQQTLNITIAASHPVQNMWVSMMKNVLQPEVDRMLRDGGNQVRVNWREAYGGTLYKFQDTMEAVRDNITDIGFVGTLWESSTMPLQNVTYFTPFATGDHGVVARAFDELNEKAPAIRQNWNGLNIVPVASFITDTYHIWSNFPIRTLDDLRNRKLSAPGTSANWLSGTGRRRSMAR